MPIETQTDSPVAADRLISYPLSFVKVTGNVSSAIFLNQLISLSKNASGTDGWISKSLREWEDLTGMRRNEQDSARKKLREVNFLEEEVRGVPATLYFRLKHDEIARLLPEANQFAESGDSSADQPIKSVMHPQAEQQKSSERNFRNSVGNAFKQLEIKIDGVKHQTELLNMQAAENSKPLEQIAIMLIALLVMAFLILILCISIWWSQPDYQDYATSKHVPTSTTLQNRK